MKTKVVIGDSYEELIQGIGLLSGKYQQSYTESDGHKIFLINRKSLYTLVNYKYEGENETHPAEEREIIFSPPEILDSLASRKDIDSQMSIRKISQGRNSEKHCEELIDWLLCKDLS